MKKYKILCLGAGGPAGIGMTRCLSEFDTYGLDDSIWGRKLMEVPEAPDNLEYDLLIPVPTPTIEKSAGNEKTYLPPLKDIELCNDKAALANVLGDLAPKTYWVRDTHGSGGKGAQMCSEYLPGKNLACELLYFEGKLEALFQKERVSYKSSKISHEVTGSAMIARCISDPLLLALSEQAIAKFNDKPHGIYSVDFKENEDGEPKITEINAGRFVTSSYIFYYSCNYNLPKRMVELALELPLSPLGKYPDGALVIRQVDRMPYVEYANKN